jgi:hypothetical protein
LPQGWNNFGTIPKHSRQWLQTKNYKNYIETLPTDPTRISSP